ncbi:unnamed protein product, partial [Rotaria socialis]
SKRGFPDGRKSLGEKKNLAVDRARRDVLGARKSLVGASFTANIFKKYSNPDLRYPTYFPYGHKLSVNNM